ncbi:MAG TPA: N-acetyltransferase [Ornithinibacillus sp.]|nr:N-acetyltransferase [Ornithinibacillus sp.]
MVQVNDLVMEERVIETVDLLYEQIWNHSIKERLIKHSGYKGFRGNIIISDHKELLGFSYGYSSLPDQFYHNLLASELSSLEYEKWLKDCFELVELAVYPSYRGQGYGKQLITNLLADIQHKTSILTTQIENKSARSLYHSLGWEVIKEPFVSDQNGPAYVIMGKVFR